MQIALILVLFAAAAAPARAQRPANDPQARSLRGTALIRKPNGSGTGWIVEWEKGLMVTNEYVVEQVEVIVPLSNSDGRPIADLASLRFSTHGIVADPTFPTAGLRRSDSPTGTHPAT